MSLQVLPLAITMVIGPVLMVAVVLVTNERAVTVSLAYLGGMAIAVVVGATLSRRWRPCSGTRCRSAPCSREWWRVADQHRRVLLLHRADRGVLVIERNTHEE